MRRARLLAAAGAVALVAVVAAKSWSNHHFSEPECSGDSICMEFAGATYFDEGAASTTSQGDGMVVTGSLRRIGASDRVTGNIGQAGFDVFAIPSVDSSRAVATRWLVPENVSPPNHGDLFIWLRAGLTTSDVTELCAFVVRRPGWCPAASP
jgi:hypothetical protein